jgi:hypothetical protein
VPRIGGLATLSDVVPSARTISTTAPLTGGGDLSTDRNLGLTFGTAPNTAAAGDHGHTAATLGATGVANNTTFLRGDNTWAVPVGGVDTEQVRDVLGATLVGGQNVSITVDDPADTVTISAVGTGEGGTISDATTSTKGIVRLAGDLAGTADTPTVPGAQKTVEKSTAASPVANGYIGADGSGKVATALLPAASTSASGILQLAGDLGGNASAPLVVRRGPLGGHIQVGYASTLTLNATTGNSFYVTATGNVSIANPTGTPADGQRVLLEVYASGGSRLVSISGPTVMAGLGTSINIASGKIGLVGLVYTARANRWVVAALNSEA